MLHSKSKSNQINPKDDSINKSNDNEKPNSTKEYTSTTANQINATNDNFDLNLSNDDNIGKLSTLFYDQDNTDKVVNISKLDESLNFSGKNSNRDEYIQKNQKSSSNYKLNTNNIIVDDENSDTYINIQYINSQIKKQEGNNGENLDKINNNVNNNMNITEQNKNKIINTKDEIFLIKKRTKIKIRILIILVVILLIIIFSLIIIFIIYLSKK